MIGEANPCHDAKWVMQTMTKSDQTPAAPAMSRPAEDQLVDYQSFNIFALVGFVLGLASVASLLLAESLFWIIPAAGTVLSLYALWTIARGGRAQVGRPLAIVGLCLSLFFLVAAPTAALVEGQYIRAESRAFADKWFEYLRQGDAVAAYDMTLNYPSRAFRNDLSDRTLHFGPGAMWSYFDQNEWPEKVRAAHDDATVEYVGTPLAVFQNSRYLVRLRYDIRLSKQDIGEPFDLTLEREKDYSSGRWHWRITRLERVNKPKPSSPH